MYHSPNDSYSGHFERLKRESDPLWGRAFFGPIFKPDSYYSSFQQIS